MIDPATFETRGEIELDERGRTNLKKFAEHKRYVVKTNAWGVIWLEPVATITRDEFHKKLESAIESIRDGNGVVVDDLDEFFQKL